MALQTSGINISTALGVAAGGVSEVLEGRRTRSEQKADLFELKDRELDDEEELFRRKDKRAKKTEMENWIATINSYLPTKQAQEVILNATSQGHQYVGVLAKRLATLADNGISSIDVYNTNKNALDPANTDASTIPFADLLIPRKKVSGNKFTQYQARFVDLSVRRSQTNDPDTLKLLDDEQKLLEKDFGAYQKIANPSNKTEGEYKSNFSKQSASATVFGTYEHLLKARHNIDLSMTEEITKWKETNVVEVIDQMTKFSRMLDVNVKNNIENGMQIGKEPSYALAVNSFKNDTQNILATYLTKEYNNLANNIPSKIITERDSDGNAILISQSKIQKNLNKGVYKQGDIVPFLYKGRNANWIYSGYKSFGQNVISASKKKDN